jgi:hypothetical protein
MSESGSLSIALHAMKQSTTAEYRMMGMASKCAQRLDFKAPIQSLAVFYPHRLVIS